MATDRLYARSYSIPTAFEAHLAGKRIAVVDDVINAGSAVTATLTALEAVKGHVVVVSALMTLGPVGRQTDHRARNRRRNTPISQPRDLARGPMPTLRQKRSTGALNARPEPHHSANRKPPGHPAVSASLVREGCRHRILAVLSRVFSDGGRLRVLEIGSGRQVNRPSGRIPAVRDLA
jgi:hypothetical protein